MLKPGFPYQAYYNIFWALGIERFFETTEKVQHYKQLENRNTLYKTETKALQLYIKIS